jgi:MoaA/NifB/PqqE/SkfB family radical SAM enzyme
MAIVPPVLGTNPRSFCNQVKDLPPPPPGACLTDNRWKRMQTLFYHYLLQFSSGLKAGIPVQEMLVGRLPHIIPVQPKPPGVQVEFTNHCNLHCVYCTHKERPRPLGFMPDNVFDALLESIRDDRVNRVYLVGLGEPTLHPKFTEYLRALRRATKYISLTTNLNRLSEEQAECIVNTPVNLLNISVDGYDKASYEKSRVNGKFDLLLKHLNLIKTLKRKSGSKTLTNIRVMLPPSLLKEYPSIKSFWAPYADEVSLQYIVNINGHTTDAFNVAVARGRYPKCSLPFKQLDVHWNGDVPLCTYSEHQEDNVGDYLLGNILQHSLKELWQSPLISHYRKAQKQRDFDAMPLCNGCGGC